MILKTPKITLNAFIYRCFCNFYNFLCYTQNVSKMCPFLSRCVQNVSSYLCRIFNSSSHKLKYASAGKYRAYLSSMLITGMLNSVFKSISLISIVISPLT